MLLIFWCSCRQAYEEELWSGEVGRQTPISVGSQCRRNRGNEQCGMKEGFFQWTSQPSSFKFSTQQRAENLAGITFAKEAINCLAENFLVSCKCAMSLWKSKTANIIWQIVWLLSNRITTIGANTTPLLSANNYFYLYCDTMQVFKRIFMSNWVEIAASIARNTQRRNLFQ